MAHVINETSRRRRGAGPGAHNPTGATGGLDGVAEGPTPAMSEGATPHGREEGALQRVVPHTVPAGASEAGLPSRCIRGARLSRAIEDGGPVLCLELHVCADAIAALHEELVAWVRARMASDNPFLEG